MCVSIEEIHEKLLGPGGAFELVEEEVLGERMQVFRRRPGSLRELLAASRAHGDKEYLVAGDQRINYADHADRVASVATALRERYRVKRGDRVAILAANSTEWIISFWATVSLGAIAVALNGWWTRDEILYGIEDANPRLLIGDRKRLARLQPGDADVPVVEMESDFEALLAYAPGSDLPDDPIDEDDPAVILYTSGTTGRPKGAVNSHRNILAFVSLVQFSGFRLMLHAVEKGVQADPNAVATCTLVNAPLFHLSGLYAGAVSNLANGLKTVWMPGRFDPARVLELIEKESVTGWSPMGSMAHRVLSHPDFSRYDLSSVRTLGSGGAPVSAETQQQLQAGFPNARGSMGLGYGLSESTGSGAMIFGEFLAARPDSVGQPAPTVEIEVRDESGRALPEGREGEIHLRGPVVMLGYWRKEAATRETLAPGRWLRTGDVGRLSEGYLYINSRARDMILRSAENIYPVEIEHRLEAHPAVQEAAVFGVAHEELGQEVKAVVVAAPEASASTADLAAHCAETLAAYKVPSLWEVRADALPRNASGKVLKHVLSGDAENTFVEE